MDRRSGRPTGRQPRRSGRCRLRTRPRPARRPRQQATADGCHVRPETAAIPGSAARRECGGDDHEFLQVRLGEGQFSLACCELRCTGAGPRSSWCLPPFASPPEEGHQPPEMCRLDPSRPSPLRRRRNGRAGARWKTAPPGSPRSCFGSNGTSQRRSCAESPAASGSCPWCRFVQADGPVGFGCRTYR